MDKGAWLEKKLSTQVGVTARALVIYILIIYCDIISNKNVSLI